MSTGKSGDILTSVKSRKSFRLISELGRGGEGVVYSTNSKDHVAKIYSNPNQRTFEKIRYMIANRPIDDDLDHPKVAWPTDILATKNGEIIGFLMPAVKNSIPLQRLFMSQFRQKYAPGVTWFHLHLVALELCKIFSALHKKGYVIGDVKQTNVLVTLTGDINISVTLIDMDSIQVENTERGEKYFCSVFTPKYTAHELLNVDLKNEWRTLQSDNFSLAALLHQVLLGEDFFPNGGIWNGGGKDWPSPEECIKHNYWNYGLNGKVKPGKRTRGIDILHRSLAGFFLKAFNDGHLKPKLRPNAAQWKTAVVESMRDLRVCSENSQHVYATCSPSCPWCQRHTLLGQDLFPSVKSNYRFNHKYLIRDSFVTHLKNKEYQHVLHLWQRWHLGSLDGYKEYMPEIEKVKLRSNFYDDFINCCEQKSKDEVEFISIWHETPDLKIWQNVRRGTVNGLDLTKHIKMLENIIEVYKLFAEAGIDNTDGQNNIETEEKIAGLWKQYNEILKGSFRYKSYKKRGVSAKSRVEAFKQLKLAFSENDEKKLANIWGNHNKILRNIDALSI